MSAELTRTRTDGVQTMSDANQRGGGELDLDSPLDLCISLNVDTASGLVL